MKQYAEYDTSSGVIGYNIITDEETREVTASVAAHRGRDVSIDIPSHIVYGDARVPVVSIEKKAFLSDRNLHSISVPATVGHVGEWAFAGCRQLEMISLPTAATVSNGAFKDCVSLRQVSLVRPGEARGAADGTHPGPDVSDTSYLLAAVIQLMDDRYLFDLKSAGTPDWFANWDMRMDAILSERDDEGFSALLACGEEDYEGRDNTLDAYLARRRARKVRLCLVRLMHDERLSDERRERLGRYLYDHRAGCAHPDTWRVILTEHGDEETYYDLIHRYGCIDEAAIPIMLDDMGDLHAGMKAYLIRLGSESSEQGFFDSMDLL